MKSQKTTIRQPSSYSQPPPPEPLGLCKRHQGPGEGRQEPDVSTQQGHPPAYLVIHLRVNIYTCHIILYHIRLCNIILYHIKSHHAIPYHITSYHIHLLAFRSGGRAFKGEKPCLHEYRVMFCYGQVARFCGDGSATGSLPSAFKGRPIHKSQLYKCLVSTPNPFKGALYEEHPAPCGGTNKTSLKSFLVPLWIQPC